MFGEQSDRSKNQEPVGQGLSLPGSPEAMRVILLRTIRAGTSPAPTSPEPIPRCWAALHFFAFSSSTSFL